MHELLSGGFVFYILVGAAIYGVGFYRGFDQGRETEQTANRFKRMQELMGRE